MVRVRIVTSPIWSEEHLVAALAQVGFATVEVNRSPVSLTSWRNTPLGVDASLIVRRQHIGAASDDLGFLRNARGSFDMILSEGNFFRFDRRWIEDVAKRHDQLTAAAGRSAPANLPGWEKRYLGTIPTTAPPLPIAGAEPTRDAAHRGRPEDASHAQQSTRARAEAAVALDELRKKQKRADGPGCILALFAPPAVWAFLAANDSAFQSPGAFFLVVLPLWVAFAIVRGIRMARRTRQAAQQLLDRLPSSAVAKETAQEYLRSKVKPAGAKLEDALVKDLLKAIRGEEK